MGVSIRQAFENVCSERYNKTNCAILILFNIFTCCFLLQLDWKLTTLGIILMFIGAGLHYLGTNNAIHNYRRGVIPNLFHNFLEISITGIKHTFCALISWFIFCVIPILLYMITAVVLLKDFNPTIMTIASILFFILLLIFLVFIFLYIPLNVYIGLKCKDWFNLKKANFLRKKDRNKHALATLIFKGICISLLIGFLIGSFSSIIILIISFTQGGNLNNQITSIVQGFSQGLSSSIFTLIYMDLTAQAVKTILPNLGKQKQQPTEQSLYVSDIQEI